MNRFHWIMAGLFTLIIVSVCVIGLLVFSSNSARAGEQCATETETAFRHRMMAQKIKPDASFTMKKEAVDKVLNFANVNLLAQGYPGKWVADAGLMAIYFDDSVLTALFQDGCLVESSNHAFSSAEWNEFIKDTGVSPKEFTIDILGKTGAPT